MKTRNNAFLPEHIVQRETFQKMVKLIRAISIANNAKILQRRMEEKILKSKKSGRYVR